MLPSASSQIAPHARRLTVCIHLTRRAHPHHHRWVGTPQDHSTARKGELFFVFFPRCAHLSPGTGVRALFSRVWQHASVCVHALCAR